MRDPQDPRVLCSGISAEAASYVGLPTFAGLPYVEDVSHLETLLPDAAVIGAPWDGSSWHRPGARFGPRELRAAALRPGGYHLDLELAIFDHLSVVDFGDAVCRHGLIDASHLAIERKVKEVASRNIVPIVLGGDHSITRPAAIGAMDSHPGPVGLLHFDAHADTADDVEGNVLSHGTPIRRLIDSAAVSGSNVVQFGLRGYWPDADTLAWMRDSGVTWYLASDLRGNALAGVLSRELARLREHCIGVYLSVDIDVLDPAFAPGTGTPEPGGLATWELMEAVRSVAQSTPLIGMDIVEVNPPFDHADLTINAAQRVVIEVLAGLAARKRGDTA